MGGNRVDIGYSVGKLYLIWSDADRNEIVSSPADRRHLEYAAANIKNSVIDQTVSAVWVGFCGPVVWVLSVAYVRRLD